MKDKEAIIHPKRHRNLLFRDIALLMGLVLVFLALASPEQLMRRCFNRVEQSIGSVIGQLNPDTVISIVKEGTFLRYDYTTIGKAFDAFFENPKWEYKVGENGMKLVEFTGQSKRNIVGYNGLLPFLLVKGDRLRFQFSVQPKYNTMKLYSMVIQLAPLITADEIPPDLRVIDRPKDLHGIEIKYGTDDIATRLINSLLEEIFQTH